ncbi:MAG: hypothetical protein Q4D42_01470 [Eubacteriales bacterium]|nr:hypothetical protein [Eubacteriales bacterium]
MKWNRGTYQIAGCIAIIVLIVLSKLFVFAPVFEIGRLAFVLLILLMALPTIFFVGWALKNESRKGGILQAIGIILIFVGFTFLWFALQNPQMTWTFPIPLSTFFIIYVAVIFLCFAFATPPGRK